MVSVGLEEEVLEELEEEVLDELEEDVAFSVVYH
jgi:hypothetical protein